MSHFGITTLLVAQLVCGSAALAAAPTAATASHQAQRMAAFAVEQSRALEHCDHLDMPARPSCEQAMQRVRTHMLEQIKRESTQEVQRELGAAR